MKNKDEDGSTEASGSGGGTGKPSFSDLSATPDEPQAAVAIPAFMKNARKAKTAEAVTNVKKMYDGATNEQDADSEESMQLRAKLAEVPDNHSDEEEGMQLRSKRAEVMPQTREHVLLAKQPSDSSGAANSGNGNTNQTTWGSGNNS